MNSAVNWARRKKSGQWSRQAGKLSAGFSPLDWHADLTVAAAIVLALESLVFVGAHTEYHEFGSIVMVCVLGLPTAFIAYGRMVLSPLR